MTAVGEESIAMTYDLEARTHGLFASGRFCERHHIDPDDAALRDWNIGRLTEQRLLHWDAESPEREESRRIAVAVAAATFRIDNGPEANDLESPTFERLSFLIGDRLNDLIDQKTFEQKVDQLVPA